MQLRASHKVERHLRLLHITHVPGYDEVELQCNDNLAVLHNNHMHQIGTSKLPITESQSEYLEQTHDC